MSAPIRIQRKRTAGWRMPDNAIYVGRPTRWGNPYRSKDPQEAVDLFRRLWTEFLEREADALPRLRRNLGGKNLACWCPLPAPGKPDLCHAAVLLEIANR